MLQLILKVRPYWPVRFFSPSPPKPSSTTALPCPSSLPSSSSNTFSTSYKPGSIIFHNSLPDCAVPAWPHDHLPAPATRSKHRATVSPRHATLSAQHSEQSESYQRSPSVGLYCGQGSSHSHLPPSDTSARNVNACPGADAA